jgi:uncharacterized protein YndB with AHSA1/START domain
MKNQKGHLEVFGDYATITITRDIAHPPAAVWTAITDPEEVAQWFMATLTIDAKQGGTVDLVAGPAKFHTFGKILEWKPMKVFEYEYKVAPRAELPKGEDATVRWELSASEKGTHVQVIYKRLTKPAALGFLPGMHLFLDRLQAQLDKAALPTWEKRFPELQSMYSAELSAAAAAK